MNYLPFLTFILFCACLHANVWETSMEDFTQDQVNVFSSAGKPKAGKTDFSISYPKSWKPLSNHRDGVVTRITCCGGDGPEALVIFVRQLRESKFRVKDDDWKTMIKDFAFPGAKIMSRERIKTKRFDGAKFTYYLSQKRGLIEINTHVTNYIFFQNGAMVQLQFYVTIGEDEAENQIRIDAMKHVWEEFMSSLSFKG